VDHAWSPDKRQLAVAANGDEVFIYDCKDREPKNWEKKHILTEHEGFVSSVDWSKNGQLVTAGHDRNAYVWEYDRNEDTWKPTLVILRINRAATSVKWSPSALKFAVASGAKCVPVCYFEGSNNWFISKMIKKHKSTVTSLAWSPNSKFLFTGCTDFKARVCSAFIAELDSKDEDDLSNVFGEKSLEFGEVLAEFNSQGWVNSTAWSPNGFTLAFASHASTLTFIDLKDGKFPAQTINQPGLPHLDIQFLDDNTLVAGGYDFNPTVYKFAGGEWKFAEALDKGDAKAAPAAAAAGKPSAFAKWSAADSRGQKFGEEGGAEDIITKHKNAISRIRDIGNHEITSSGVDGRVLFWRVP